MKKMLLIASLGLSTALLTACGGSGCSEDDLKAKAAAVSQGVQKLALSDPAKMQELAKKLMSASAQFGENSDINEACKFYDEILDEIK